MNTATPFPLISPIE